MEASRRADNGHGQQRQLHRDQQPDCRNLHVAWRIDGRAAINALQIVAHRPPAAAVPITGGLVLWLDGQDVDGNDDGQSAGSVSIWVDKSGSGNNATNAGADAPDLELGVGPGGTDGVDFDGNDFLNSGAALSEDATFFAVFTPDVVADNDVLLGSRHSASGSYYMQVQSGSAHGRMYMVSPAGNIGRVDGNVSAGTDYLFTYVFDFNTAGGAELLLDGLSRGTANTTHAAASVLATN